MSESLAAQQAVAPFVPLADFKDEGMQDFAQMVRNCTEMRDLRAAMSHVTQQLGFDYFSLACHIERRPLRGPLCEPLALDDFPLVWKRMAAARRYFADDPVLAAVEKSAAAFVWSDISEIITLTPRQREVMDAALSLGLGNGFTVPLHVPGGSTGSCSFVLRSGHDLPWDMLPAAHYIGAQAFDTIRRLAAKAPPVPPRLTQRQFDCIVLVAQGKSDWDVGCLLGISDQTVHKHIEDAKRRYGVATRIQLVVRTLFDNQLTFGDILAAPPSSL